MRTIVKGPEPPSLTAHRQTPHSDYANYRDKDALRGALVSEQRGLCCYCMGSIDPHTDAMKIEHWRCQAHYPNMQLEYHNLLGACLGGEGQPLEFQHCDTRKGHQDLSWNPADPSLNIESCVGYGNDGTIWSCDTVFDDQLNEVLNLNLALLKNRRKAVVDSLFLWSEQEHPVSRENIQSKLNEFTNGNDKLTPDCEVAVWWLQKKLEELQGLHDEQHAQCGNGWRDRYR